MSRRSILSGRRVCKRGFVGDIGIVIGLLFAFSLIVVIGWKVFDTYNDSYQAGDATVESKALVDENADRYVGVFDGMFLFILFGLAVALFLSTSYIDTRPEFFFITIIAAVIFVGLSAVVSNAFEDFSTTSDLVNSTGDFSVVPAVMDKLPLVTLVLVAATLMGLYFKSRGVF